MCEKRTRKIKKGTQVNRLRENRRMQRLRWLTSPARTVAEPPRCPGPSAAEKSLIQNRVLMELTWKTVALMQKNKLIQEKIVALQKETTEFVTNIMNNPENRKRYLDHLRLYGTQPLQMKQEVRAEAENKTLKLEPAES